MVTVSARMVVVMVASAASAPTSAVAATGGPRWGTSRPSALCWRCTQGPSGPALRHQRVAKADTRGTLAAKGIIIWVQGRMSRGFSRWLRSTAESQLRHRVAVWGPSQKAGGFVGACSRLGLGTGAFTCRLRCPLCSRERSRRSCEWCGHCAGAPAAAARPGSSGLSPEAAGS